MSFAVRLQAFQGEVPKLDRRTLGDNQAQTAVNLMLTGGVLDPLFFPKRITASLVSNAKTVYRLYDDSGSYWLSWASDVDTAPSPIIGDTDKLFYTSDAHEPRVTTIALATASSPYPGSAYALGVCPPITAPTVTQDGSGSGTDEERAYVTTIADGWGWESAPSPASTIVSGKPDAVWSITGFDALPANAGTVLSATISDGLAALVLDNVYGLRQYDTLVVTGIAGLTGEVRIVELDTAAKTAYIAAPSGISGSSGTWRRAAPFNLTGAKRRLYRTVTTSQGTDYYFVKEADFALLTLVDDVGANVGEPLPTQLWQMPPANLRGLHLHPSGAMVGFVDKTVWMSEPLSPYAWNPNYRLTSAHPIVGLGLIDTAVVACTAGRPMMWQGTAPESMSPVRMREVAYPCLSKRSIVDMGNAVLYASVVGPVVVDGSGARAAMPDTFTFKEWERFSPSSMTGAAFDDKYFIVHGEVTNGEPAETIILSGGTLSRFDWVPTALYTDAETGKLYFVLNDNLYEWNADEALRMAGTWQSKEMVVATPVNLGAAKIDGEFTLTDADRAALIAAQEAVKAANAALIAANASGGSFNGSSFNTLSFNGSRVKKPQDVDEASQVVFTLVVNGEDYFSKVVTHNKVFRLKAGKKYDAFSVRVSGPVKIRSIPIGETADDLRRV